MGTRLVIVTALYHENTSAIPALDRSCKDIKATHPSSGDDLYWLDSDGGNQSNAFLAYCDMTSYNGGWTMCYTTDSKAEPRDEIAYNPQNPYGTVGYRTDCNNILVSPQWWNSVSFGYAGHSFEWGRSHWKLYFLFLFFIARFPFSFVWYGLYIMRVIFSPLLSEDICQLHEASTDETRSHSSKPYPHCDPQTENKCPELEHPTLPRNKPDALQPFTCSHFMMMSFMQKHSLKEIKNHGIKETYN